MSNLEQAIAIVFPANRQCKITLQVQLGAVAALILFTGTAASQAGPAMPGQPNCYARIVSQAVFPDLRRARAQSLKNWTRSVAAIYGNRAARWSKARFRRTRVTRDTIEQKWMVTRSASPCGPGFIAKRRSYG